MIPPVLLLLFFFFFSLFADHSASSDECPSFFDCGYLGKFWFPLTTPERKDCGMLPIHGCEDPKAQKTVQLGKKMFQVTRIEGWWLPEVVVRDTCLEKRLASNSCDALRSNITLPPNSPLGSFHILPNITMYKCNTPLNQSLSKQFLNYTGCAKSKNRKNETFFFQAQDQHDPPPPLATCPRVQLPVNMLAFSADPFTFIASEFRVSCQPSHDCASCLFDKGSCRLNSTREFYCLKGIERWAGKLGLKIGFGVGSGILILALLLCFGLYKHKQNAISHVRLRSANQHPNDADPDSGRLFFGVPIFSYTELQGATNNFDPSKKLGDGGFGSVYYGKLQDGREVAVKHLFNHNYKRVEQFMKEVEILTRLRHQNLVCLYGCTSHQSRELLLVYEYIPNGTLASHLRRSSTNPALLTWPVRTKIAIETASALAYLHASGIIHRDVKTNNILLDKNFCVKVADFGLSRLFPDDVSHVSTAPQGTPGYLDPEYHYCFRLTDKSNVYSFGVVLMELISSMPAVDMGRSKDEITLAGLTARKIQRNEFEELVDPSLGIEKDSEVKKKVFAVRELAFQCLQIDKEMRPSIDEVLEVLRKIEGGKVEEEEEEDKNTGKDGDGGEVLKNKANIKARAVTSISFDQAKLFKSVSSPNNIIQKWGNGKIDQGKLFSV